MSNTKTGSDNGDLDKGGLVNNKNYDHRDEDVKDAKCNQHCLTWIVEVRGNVASGQSEGLSSELL